MRFPSVICLVSLVLVLLPSPVRAEDSPHSTFSEPFTDFFQNACTGELVTVAGTVSGHTVSVTDAHGGTHQHQAIVIRAAGTGNFGNAYHYTQRFNLALNAGDRSSETITYRERLLSTTGGPSYPIAATLHLTVGEEGEIRADVVHITETCVGQPAET